MQVYVSSSSESFGSELFEIARIFYPDAVRDSRPAEFCVEHAAHGTLREWSDELSVVLPSGARRREVIQTPHHPDSLVLIRRRKRAIKMRLYRMLKLETGINPPWGALTGVRPMRLFAEQIEAGVTPRKAVVNLARSFDISIRKVDLLADVYWMQRALLDQTGSDIDIYVGIPFCPSVCDYCSFGTSSVQSFSPLQVQTYVEALKHELISIQPMLREMGFRARCVYVGGGTPTTLPSHLLEDLLRALRGLFPEAQEWTVEAGRPDTLDKEHIAVLRDARIGRISINPQTMNDETLRRIGRGHTPGQVIEAYHRARPFFPIINMDLIVALPGETLSDIENTLDFIEVLRPENYTVHTLAIKRASGYHREGIRHGESTEAAAMIDAAAARARAMGALPYYLYRQKGTAGGLENVGYARPGTACRYNVDIMEETVAIAAFGAGGISKALFPDRRIERVANVRNIDEYMLRIEEMIARKRVLWKAQNV